MKMYQRPELEAHQLVAERGFAYSDIPDNLPGPEDDSTLDYDNGGDAW